MRIQFDANIKLAGIGMVPWTRLGPEQWFDSYVIASLYGWDINQAPFKVVALSEHCHPLPLLPRINTQALLATTEFQELLNTRLAGYDLLTYKPVKVPPELENRKFLMTQPKYTSEYENKVNFRSIFKTRVNIPSFVVYNRTDLHATTGRYAELMQGREQIIMQDEQLSGGKGTFFVTSYKDYEYALVSLERLSTHRKVVVSDVVHNAKERTIQAVVTEYGVFTGPLQRQIVAHPLLSNTNVAEGDKFCGVSILEIDQNTQEHAAAISAAQEIGQELQKKGYRGIFGVDFLVSEKGSLYTLEINPRITGATPLLTALYGSEAGVPFYLLHILELGKYNYQLFNTKTEFTEFGSMLIFHSLEDKVVNLVSSPASGTYSLENNTLQPVSANIDIHKLNNGEFIIQDYTPPGMNIKPGGRLVTVQTREAIVDENTDQLYNSTVNLISAVRNTIITKSVS